MTVYDPTSFITYGPTSFTFTDTMPSPEFPSLALPVSMIIGFLGAVLLIQRTRKQ